MISGDAPPSLGTPSGAAGTPPPRRSATRRILVPVALLAGAVALGGCNSPTFFAFRGATTQGHDIFKLWSGMMIAGVIVAILVWALIFWAVFRYRRSRVGPRIPRQFHSNIPIEIIYTTIPVLIVAGIFWATVVTENNVDTVVKNPAEIVHVTAYRWGWRFAYFSGSGADQHVLVQTSGTPSGAALPVTSSAYPQLVLPVNATARIDLVSADVVHEMWVPAFDFGRYALPGHENTWDFTPNTLGVFRGQCAEYCGLYHAEMLFSVKVVPDAQFQQWLSAHSSSPKGGAVS